MKLIVSIVLLVISSASEASARCTIDFENEISANRTTHNLYRHIRANKSFLSNKGYRLVSAIGPLPTFSGFMQVDDFDSSRLALTVYKIDSSKAWNTTVKFKNLSIAVKSLLKKLPSCNNFHP